MEFLRISTKKVILAAVFSLAHFLIVVIGFYCGWDSTSMASPQCKFLLVPVYHVALAPSTLISAVFNVEFNPFEMPYYQLSWVVQILWSYVLASLVVEIINKRFPKKTASQDPSIR